MDVDGIRDLIDEDTAVSIAALSSARRTHDGFDDTVDVVSGHERRLLATGSFRV
jgi:hypothetical protein